MNLKRCHLIKNPCYIKNEKMTGKPYGIVVHSTAANNTSVKRYVQPVSGQDKYDEIRSDLGVNQYGNHWNRSGVSKCVHAFIGKNAAGDIVTYETLPHYICCWGCGSGSKGSYNYNPTPCIQFEICEDSRNNVTYFNAVMKEAMEYCAYICALYDIPVDRVVSHNEAGKMKMAGSSSDIEHWLTLYGHDMKWFRAGVQALLCENEEKPEYYYMVYSGSYPSQAEAETMTEKLREAGFPAVTVEVKIKK